MRMSCVHSSCRMTTHPRKALCPRVDASIGVSYSVSLHIARGLERVGLQVYACVHLSGRSRERERWGEIN